MNNENKTSKLGKVVRLCLLIVSLMFIFAISALAATPYEVTKSGGAHIRTTYYESGASVRKAPQGSILWVKSSKRNLAGNLWYQLTDGYWIFSNNVKAHSCSWTYTGGCSPTCTATGRSNYRCNKCGQTDWDSIPAKGHKYSGNVCTVCGVWNTASLKSRKSVSSVKYYVTTNGAKVHSGPYGACSTVATLNKGNEIVVTEELVNASGNTWYRYSGGYIYSDYVLLHSSCLWSPSSIIKPSNCQNTGVSSRYCLVCGKTKTSTTPAIGHTYESNVCKRCGTWNTASLKSKTTLNNVKYYVKTNGAKVHSGPYGGCSTVKTLNKGNEIIVTQKLVNASNNTWYKYSGGYIFSDYVIEHNSCLWTTVSINKAATCQSTGTRTQVCGICGAKKTSTIAKLSHNYKSNVCKSCGTWNTASLKSKTTINNVKYCIVTAGAKVRTGPYEGCAAVRTLAKGTDIVVTQKVVNASGNTWYKYSGGYVYSNHVKQHKSCSWNSGKVTKAATCKSTGTKVQTCTVCQKTKTTTIAKTGHKYKNNVCTTCSAWKASSLKSKKTVNNVKYYVVKSGAKVRPGPYSGCKATKTLSKGTEIVVTEKVVNASGNTWYRYSGGYVYSDYLKAHNSCSWNSGKVTKAATCQSTGTKVQTCTVCQKTKKTTIAKTGHQYKNNVCKTCNVWKTSSLKSTKTVNNLKYYATKDNVKIRSGPYEGCKAVKTLYMGYNIVVTQKVVNASGSTWYKCSDGYIYGGNVKAYSQSKASVTLNADKLTLYVGETRQLKAVIKGPSDKVTWKSSNSSVASVSSTGKITVKKAGSCTITATANGKKDTCKITAKQLAVPKGITVSTIKTGRQFKISHKAVSGASGYELVYSFLSNKKTKTYTGTSTTVTVPNGTECDYKCTVRAYKVINGKKVYSKYSTTYGVHVHNAKSNTTKTSTVKVSSADYTYHTVKTVTTFTCSGCRKTITHKTSSKKAKHSFVSGVCGTCGEKKAANYVIGKIYPEVGAGPSYSSSEKKNDQNPIYMAAKYSDSFFTKDSTKFSSDLCKLSAIGASASYNKTFAKEFLAECKFSGVKNIFSGEINGIKESTSKKGKNDHARITIGYKKIAGTNTTVVAVLVNGYNTGAYEWISNFNVGKSGLHEGFSKAAAEVTATIHKYIKDKKLNTANLKIWVTGHSRAGAITGMTAVDLNKTYGIKNVYAYGFATPNGVPTGINKNTNSKNIFNIINPGDFVPYVVPSSWNFTKFGTTTEIKVNTAVKNAYKTMSGDTYSGLTEAERKSLISAFCDYSPNREAYYKKAKYSSPSDFGRALGVFLSKADKAEALELIAKCVADNGDSINVLAQMVYDGKVTTKIHEAHTMETYVALVYNKYP